MFYLIASFALSRIQFHSSHHGYITNLPHDACILSLNPIQVVKITELLRALENAGEIGVSIAIHTVDGTAVKRTKPCCFVLDPPKEKTLLKKVPVGKLFVQQ